MLKRERIPFPSSKGLETMKGEVSGEKEVILGSGEKKFVRLVEKGGGLIGVPDKKEWAEILNHSLIVTRVANYLARELKQAGEDIDLKLVNESALLHDVGKRYEQQAKHKEDSDTVGSHAQEGARVLKDENFSEEIVDIVKAHYFPQRKEEMDTWEKKIVFYADSRVGQSTVLLDERLEDIEKRWVPNKITQETMDKTKKIAQDIEQEIFSKLEIKPNEISNLPAPRVERYLRTIVERNLEDRAIKFFRELEDRKAKNKVEKE